MNSQHLIEPTTLLASAPRERIERALAGDAFRPMAEVQWLPLEGRVETRWKLLHGPDAFFLHFECEEPWIRAVNKGDTGPICEDSCVEWFVACRKDEYINFEFNPIGAINVERGLSRSPRHRYRLKELPGLRVWTDRGDEPFETQPAQMPWRVWAVIPRALIIQKSGDVSDWRANFYKCGDCLPNPHYLSWAPVPIPDPDFHRPDFFAPLHMKPL
ncbi:MAG: hypothetical protein HQL32_07090 [Planctomycetes bacterium]|nr:hypothetical protein [Planctomycetota bacterium]